MPLNSEILQNNIFYYTEMHITIKKQFIKRCMHILLLSLKRKRRKKIARCQYQLLSQGHTESRLHFLKKILKPYLTFVTWVNPFRPRKHNWGHWSYEFFFFFFISSGKPHEFNINYIYIAHFPHVFPFLTLIVTSALSLIVFQKQICILQIWNSLILFTLKTQD